MKSSLIQMAFVILFGIAFATTGYTATVNLNGFLRSSFSVSDSTVKYLEQTDNHGDWGDTQAGFTYSAVLDEEWTVAGQFHYRVGEGEMNLDWVIATFTITDESIVQFGRLKYPLGLVSESIDIGVSYPWTRPPAEMYRLEIETNSPNLIVEGYEGMSWQYLTGDDWEFSVQPFIGQVGYKENPTSFLRKLAGVRLEATNEMVKVQAGVVSSEITVNGGPTDETKTTTNIGTVIEHDAFLVYIEYAKTEVSNSDTFDSSASYISLAYSVGKYQPYVTIAQVEGQKAAGAANGALDQSSSTVGLAFHYKPSTVFKAQLKNIKPDDPTTDGLVEALPTGKTTVNIFSFTMDTVF